MFKRLFIAIKIDPTEELLRRIHYFESNLKEENINWIKADHYHLTLKFLGKTDIAQIEEVSRILKEVSMKSRAFQLELSGIHLFGSTYSPRVIWIGTEPVDILKELNQKVIAGLKELGIESDQQNFVPHLSIARIRKLKNKDHFKRVMEKAEQGLIQSQSINKMILYESVLLPRGAEYRTIEEYPFAY